MSDTLTETLQAEMKAGKALYVEIRTPAPEHAEVNHAYLVADGTGYVQRPLADRYEGVFHASDRAEATRLARDFDEMWSSALPDPGLRRLAC